MDIPPLNSDSSYTASLFRDAHGELLTDREVALNALLSIDWGDYQYIPKREKEQLLNDALNVYNLTFYDGGFHLSNR
jgi:hypothetical protein